MLRLHIFYLEQCFRRRLQIFPRMTFTYLLEMNWFSSKGLLNDQYDQQTERISTRTFIIALIVTFVFLFIYVSAVNITSVYTVSLPTFQQFNDLNLQHAESLSCPCSKISSNYRAYIHLTYSLHPVCKSIYVTERWRQFITFTTESIAFVDFRMMGSLMFQGIQSLCELVKKIIDSSTAQFLSNMYISTTATPKHAFESYMNASIEQFIASTTKTFTWSLELIRSTTQFNPLLSGLMTNFFIDRLGSTTNTFSAPFIYGDCNCAFKRTCVVQQGLYHNYSLSNVWHIPGLYRGCFVLEALMQSHLGCFYNQTCLQELQYNLLPEVAMNVTPLDRLMLSRFTPDTTLEIIVNNLMVDEWKQSVQHDKYFDICRPLECSYIVTRRRSIILIVTTVIGLFGGLVTTLRLIVPHIVWIIRWKLKARPRIFSGQFLLQL